MVTPHFKHAIESLVPDLLISRMRTLVRGDVLTVLAFHGVESAEHFARQIEMLSRTSEFVDGPTVLASLDGEGQLPRRATLLTFDDAERSVYQNALGVLTEYRIRSVLFPVAGLIGSSEPFWWRETEWLVAQDIRPEEAMVSTASGVIRYLKAIPDSDRRGTLDEMRRRSPVAAPTYPHLSEDELRNWLEAGQEIGNHTYTHPCLPRCSEEAICEEITHAHERLSRIMGRAPRIFAYPNGDIAEAAVSTLRRLDYRLGFLFDHRFTVWPPKDPLRASRLRANSTDSLKRLGLSVSGIHPAVYHARLRLARIRR